MQEDYLPFDINIQIAKKKDIRPSRQTEKTEKHAFSRADVLLLDVFLIRHKADFSLALSRIAQFKMLQPSTFISVLLERLTIVTRGSTTT
jgi:hypothetical protein